LEYEDPQQATRRVDFDSPASNPDTGEELMFVSVRVSPNPTGSSDDEFLAATAISLINKYSEGLLSWPSSIEVDGRDGVEANYETALPFATGVVTVTGWEAVFLVDSRQWTIEVVGRSEYRGELEGIHGEFLSSFHLLPVQ
jgi:hypothetical protein